MKYILSGLFFLWAFIACTNEPEHVNDPNTENRSILDQLHENYELMPEQEIIISVDKRVYAQYATPTEKYAHGVLGDLIEAEQLVVVVDSVFYDLVLPDQFVFEDISPRLYDVDGDSELEFITIRTHVSKGASVAIYKIVNGQLVEYASVPEIGTPNRWLNIACINDLDDDGIVELVWIQTPHIGGTLKLAKVEAGTLMVLAQQEGYSNHAFGERNLCLSILTEQAGQKVFYVPNQSRNRIVGFSYVNNELKLVEQIDQAVDFSKTLGSQHSFNHPVESGNNCANE